MNYLNKFGNFVNKGINDIKYNVKSAINSQKTDEIEKGICSIHDMSSTSTQQPSQPKPDKPQPKTSMAAFFTQGKAAQQQQQSQTQHSQPTPQPQPPSSTADNYKEIFSYNPNPSYTITNKKPPQDFIKQFRLIKGENIIEFADCYIRVEDYEFPNKLVITPYRVYNIPDFEDKKATLEQWNDTAKLKDIYPDEYFIIPIHKIVTCDKPQERTNAFRYIIEITSKDGRRIEMLFPLAQRDTIYYRIYDLVHSREGPNYCSFAFRYNSASKYEEHEDGWKLYDAQREYERQGLVSLDTKPSNDPDKLFRRTTLNENFGLCESYPKFLITSARIKDDELRCASSYRTKNRLPTLAYFYYRNGATIWRSSQVKSGLTGNTNEYDIKYMRYITDTAPEKKLIVFDARPYLSAAANKLKGAGYEKVDEYGRASIEFCEIDNIHVARSALNKIYTLISHPDFNRNKKFFTEYENTKWNEFSYMLIKAAIKVALAVKQGHATLIHCSDGWDRASQLTAFSQMLVDPYFRTIRGYMTLIEKDFLSFGHQFKCRNGYYGPKDFKEDQNSPILLQYLDATHQLLVNYPMYFEFNMEFLVFIANSIHSGKYGTFLFNHEKERDYKQAKKNTMSVWTEVLRNYEKYVNPFYEPRTLEEFFFCPVFYNHKLRFWEEYFMQFNQLRVNYSYDKYINRWYNETNVYAKKGKPSKTYTEQQYINREKKELNHQIKEKEFEAMKLKICLKELMNKVGDVNDVTDKTKEVMEWIKKEDVCDYEELEKDIQQEEEFVFPPERNYDLQDTVEDKESEMESKKEENENKEEVIKDDMKGEEDEEHPEGEENNAESTKEGGDDVKGDNNNTQEQTQGDVKVDES